MDVPQLSEAVEAELRLCSKSVRDDARQHAYLAAIEGKCPRAAVRTFNSRHSRDKKRLQQHPEVNEIDQVQRAAIHALRESVGD